MVELRESVCIELELFIPFSHSVMRMLIASVMTLRLEIRRSFSGKPDKTKRRGIKIPV